MSIYKYIKNLWKKPQEGLGDLWQQRLVEWRKEPATIRIERPTRLDKARELGYKPKQGVIIIRQRVGRGGHKREARRKARSQSARTNKAVISVSYQKIAEDRAAKNYVNCEVINSYYVAQDGQYYWYEVILADKSSPAVLADKNLNWVANPANSQRAARGLTSSGRKGRGLRNKGKGAEKIRPSIRANGRRVH